MSAFSSLVSVWGLLILSQSFALFLPTIINELGYSSTNAQLLTGTLCISTAEHKLIQVVPPNLCAFVAILITSALSDKVEARGPFMLVGCSVAIVGYIMLLVAKDPAVKYGGTFLVAIGVYPGTPMRVIPPTSTMPWAKLV